MKMYEDANHPGTIYIVDTAVDSVFAQDMREEGAALVSVRFARPDDEVYHVAVANNQCGWELV